MRPNACKQPLQKSAPSFAVAGWDAFKRRGVSSRKIGRASMRQKCALHRSVYAHLEHAYRAPEEMLVRVLLRRLEQRGEVADQC